LPSEQRLLAEDVPTSSVPGPVARLALQTAQIIKCTVFLKSGETP